LSLNLSELTTSTSDADGDFFVVVDSANAQKKLTKANINISGFNNDAGYTTNVGDITGVTAGSFITGGGTSGTVTINVDATSANTASKVVARDGSGNFSAGTITAALSGNASTATTWQTARTLTLTGDVTGTSAAFNGNGNISIATTIAANSVALGTDTTGNYVATGAVSGNGLSGSASAEGATFTVTSNATNANTASTIVFRDASGNFSAGTITASLSGNATTATNITGYSGTYWTSNNDGSGSGLDADTLDGVQGASYLRSDTSDTFTGTLTLTGSMNASGTVFAESLQEDYDALSGTTPTVDADNGGAFSLTTSGNTTFTFGAVTSGRSVAFILQLTAGGTHTITWPASVDWAGGTAPDAPASGETNIYVFWSRDGGTTWYGVLSSAAAA